MTLIRLSDIRQGDVHEQAGMSNVPWELDYGFQHVGEPSDEQSDILEELYFYGPSTTNEGVLDGLSPDRDGRFLTTVLVDRQGTLTLVRYSRERLITLANKILADAMEEIALAVQREFIHEGPHVEYEYQLCPELGTTKCVVIDGVPYPLKQILDLRGTQSISFMEWVDSD